MLIGQEKCKIIYFKTILAIGLSVHYLTNRFHVAVHLLSNTWITDVKMMEEQKSGT